MVDLFMTINHTEQDDVFSYLYEHNPDILNFDQRHDMFFSIHVGFQPNCLILSLIVSG